MTPRLTGLVAAPFTPMNADGTLNPAAIKAQAALLVESGVTGAFVCGTTGEGASLSVAERIEVADRWKGAEGERLRLIVHAGHNSLPEAKRIAAHAAKIKADAIAAIPPTYFKPETVGDIVDFCSSVAEAAPGVPFYYYDIPSFTGVAPRLSEFLDQAVGRIPTLAGVKCSRGDLTTYRECVIARDGAFDAAFGNDELLLDGLKLGARGAVGSTYNFAAPVYHRIMKAFDAGDLDGARREQDKSVALVEALKEFGVIRAGKAIMKLVGADCGPVRSPLRPMDEEEIEKLYDRIKSLDVFARPLRKE